MARNPGMVTRRITRELIEGSETERSDDKRTGEIYHAALERYRSHNLEKEKVSVRSRGGTVKTRSGVPLNTAADGAGKGWPRIYIVEDELSLVCLAVFDQEGSVLVVLDWNDLWGREEFATRPAERLSRDDLMYYIQRLLGPL